MKTIIISLLLILLISPLQKETEIKLNNPSFEIPHEKPYGEQACCAAPRGWFGCGEADFNTPDVQPGHFGVEMMPAEGLYYLGMVTRDDDSWEAISQKLSEPLLPGKKYSFSIALATSREMRGLSRLTDMPVFYNHPVKLRVWGGKGYCSRVEILAESLRIENTDWKYYTLFFNPKKEHSFITFEAFYKTPSPIPYNGNLLLDNCSSISEILE